MACRTIPSITNRQTSPNGEAGTYLNTSFIPNNPFMSIFIIPLLLGDSRMIRLSR